MTPDFYLPDADIYVECTTMNQRLVARKRRKLRRVEALHDVVVVAHSRRDLERLGWVDAGAA
jgi:hypoxanthine phosphoribosyltransferase